MSQQVVSPANQKASTDTVSQNTTDKVSITPAQVPQSNKRQGARIKNPTSKQKKEFFEAKVQARKLEDKQPREVREKDPDYVRLPKKKVALLMGFSGTGYQGMQMNPNAKTIEGELWKALVAAGAVSKDNSDDPAKVSLMRAARTDKGVSAAGQVVSLKFIVDVENVISKINENLPKQIRVFGYVRTLRSFHAKTCCEARIYEYLLPSYVFIAPEIVQQERISPDVHPKASEEEMKQKHEYRVSSDILAQLREALNMYLGTKNYHNFTIGRSFGEKACNRVIKSFTASEPFIQNGMEWISCKVQGQSFMLHQIRKMIALVVMLIRSKTPLSVINKAFEETKISIPKAPGLGLLLEQPLFGSYNKKLGSKVSEHTCVDFSTVQSEMEAFKKEFIYPTILEEEKKNFVFDDFLKSVDYNPQYFGYLNPEGNIPKQLDNKLEKASNSDLEDHLED